MVHSFRAAAEIESAGVVFPTPTDAKTLSKQKTDPR
jgi:hypothetical protein